MTDPDPELQSLRHDLAAARGLGADAAAFVTGATLEEIEASADALARLVEASGEPRRQEWAEAGPDLFGDAAATRAERKQALADLFSGRAPARDRMGRFVPKTASFDGGARQPVPEQKPPEQAHAELLGQVLRTRAADRGVSF